MKTFINILIVLGVIAIITPSCRRNIPSATVKASKITDTLAKKVKQDTIIFKNPVLSALVQQTYKYFSIFDTISPMQRDYDIRKFKLSKVELDSLYSNSGETAEKMDGGIITMALSSMITVNLQKILSWKDIDKYDLSLLFKNSMSHIVSPDGRLYCFAFDEKTGGTYRSCVSFFCYAPPNSSPQRSFLLRVDSAFNKDGYDVIDTLHTTRGIKYLLSGYVMGCTTCMSNYIDLVHFEDGGFVNDFNYKVEIRNNSQGDYNLPVIAYDTKLHRININYITDDLTPVCNCDKNGSTDDGADGSDDSGSRGNEITCTYAFNGNTFVLKKSKEKYRKQ